MASEYLYGTYGHLADSVVEASTDVSTIALYVGTAPVNLVRGYAGAGVVNRPLRITSKADAQSKIGGIASDWEKFTLSEAVAAHFDNPNGNVGPIYVINVLNPATCVSETQTTVTLNFVNGRASFTSEDIILDTLALADKAEGTDYVVGYNYDTHKVMIFSADNDRPLSGAIVASYSTVNLSLITEDDIIGVKTSGGEYTGMQAAALMYPTFGAAPNLYAAPGWSGRPAVYKALVDIATKLNGHWDGFVYADIPLSYDEMVFDYEEVTDKTLDSNPASEGWHELESGVYVPSSDNHLVTDAYYSVSATAGTPDADPAAEGFYERSGETPYTYTPSADSAVDSGKTYYKLSVTEAATVRGDDPSENGWYVQEFGGYVPATDTYVVSGETYYTRSGSTEEKTIQTIAEAIAWKEKKAYTSERSKVFWPKASGTDGNIYHLSTLAMAETLRLDNSHNGVPMETCGNKGIPVNAQYFGEGSSNLGFDVLEGNGLCEKGISTVVYWSDGWKLWGDHTAAYTFGGDMDDRDIFDVSMRMLFYLTNRFQNTWAYTIDRPFTVNMRDTILIREQERLNALVTMGALIGKPTIVFETEHNTLQDIKNGNFRFDIQVTPTPPLKSASAYVAYSDAGFSAYFS